MSLPSGSFQMTWSSFHSQSKSISPLYWILKVFPKFNGKGKSGVAVRVFYLEAPLSSLQGRGVELDSIFKIAKSPVLLRRERVRKGMVWGSWISTVIIVAPAELHGVTVYPKNGRRGVFSHSWASKAKKGLFRCLILMSLANDIVTEVHIHSHLQAPLSKKDLTTITHVMVTSSFYYCNNFLQWVTSE